MDEELNNLFETDISTFARTFIEDVLGKTVNSEMGYGSYPAEADGFSMDFEGQEGGEGDGAAMWIIMSCKRLSDGAEKYVRFEGYYSSWDASEMDPRPVEVFLKKVVRSEFLSQREIDEETDQIVD